MADETLEDATKIIAEINGTFCNKDEGACDLEYCNCRVIARQIIELAQIQEREACAKVADELADSVGPLPLRIGASTCAAAIRSRALPSPDEKPR